MVVNPLALQRKVLKRLRSVWHGHPSTGRGIMIGTGNFAGLALLSTDRSTLSGANTMAGPFRKVGTELPKAGTSRGMGRPAMWGILGILAVLALLLLFFPTW
ncbi:hypothetical protein M5E06_19180 [Azospirillum sp. A1-3]|uniref:hypothetical protein n=1 Tax=Azospirillum sp. A1-3 TaxID=185874 RepID=UPI002076EC0F|nr:hypothetical protein [Azospirillum sp. A1-3]MCM8736262.1 hypothetical protein [Azospirillum sp. A1-3]